MEKIIFLVRHAEPVRIDTQRRFFGQSDPDLSAVGILQAERLGEDLKNYAIQTVYTSDLIRAQQTAARIGNRQQCRCVRIREFREICLGLWEGQTFQEIQTGYPEEYQKRGEDIAGYRIPGGESFADLQQRVLPAFHQVVNTTDGNLAIVAHAGVNRTILCHLLERPLQEFFLYRRIMRQ
ncbi:histidine phosphatase family protein [Desulfitobacterium hafniense]|uniref:Alpha-ribazole phosphatase n=1 Tax=Desulfitobacterium hafniense (strain Y51) TaxID=138119 RepID=Q24Z77_DESHY|nr:histidine phosphatase family protein [Desulfitobacterium hafniense]BAE82665.1 hypothetical protein DSY0876 [Desulfitobacterium hafniense Y51]